MANNRRKSAAIALAVIGIAGLSLASASTLDLTGGALQAGVTSLNGCQPETDAVTVGFGAPSFAGGEYGVSSVVLKGIDAACKGSTVKVTLLDAATSGAAIGSEYSVTLPAAFAGTDVTIGGSAVSAHDVEAAAVAISN